MKRHLIPFLLLLSQCGNPMEFERDNPLDPLSDAYLPNAPTNLRLVSSENDHFLIAWHADSVFDSILIERKTPQDSDFVRLSAVAKHVTQFVDSTNFTSHPISYRVGSSYRRNKKAVISYSRTLKISQELAWGNVAWNGIPNAVNIRHFSEYDDLYVMDDGVYDYNTHLKLFTVPSQGTNKPNGFTNKGGYVSQIAATSTNTTLRHYTSDGNHSGDVVIPGTSYLIGHFDDVIYLNPTNRTLERIHLPTKTTTVIEAGLPNVPSASFAIFETSIAMKIQTQMHIYRFSEGLGYALLNSFAIPSHISAQREMRMTDTQVIIRLQNGLWNYFWYINRETGFLESLSQYWTNISQYAYLQGYQWMVYFGQDAYSVDLSKSSQTRLIFHPESTGFTAQKLHRVRLRGDESEIVILRTSTSSSQLVKLKKQNAWVVE